jgi:nitroreductase
MTNDGDWRVDGSRLGRSWRNCLTAAGLAPSVHNTQPWRFRVDERAVDVLADRSRRLEVADPTGRELLISVGAAIGNLRIAIRAAGREPVLRLWPDPANTDLVARITLGPAITADHAVHTLAAAIPNRHTNRRAFAETQLPEPVIRVLRNAARTEGADLAMADAMGRMLVLGLVRRAERLLRDDPRYLDELATWSGDRSGCDDGVTTEAFGPWTAVEHCPIRTFATEPDPTVSGVALEHNPQIAVLYTYGDTNEQWVRAGQALERVLLTATAHGLATTMMTQPMELPVMRRLLADPRDDRITAQAALRLGYAPAGPASPRRPLAELLVSAPADYADRPYRLP